MKKKKSATAYHFLSQEEVHPLILGTIAISGEGGATEDEIAAVCEWADTVKLNAGLLENLLAGNMGALIKDGEPVFQMLGKGNREVEAMLAVQS